ncbi:hypothetical protein N8349_03625 [Gammaproteobacteria bacterium]|nr:hypothetical protein [Gammaproteobacteria bacterium]
MKERKERLDGILRYFVIGYPLIFVFSFFASASFSFMQRPDWLIQISDLFYFGEVIPFQSASALPLSSLTTFAILIGARYIMFGKTYQK